MTCPEGTLALYTDIDPFCCAVLGALVEDGSLPPGDAALGRGVIAGMGERGERRAAS